MNSGTRTVCFIMPTKSVVNHVTSVYLASGNLLNKPLSKLTLQEAFRQRMQAFITRSEARQRLIRLETLERRLKSERKGLKTSNDSNNNIRSSISLPSSFNHPKSWGNAASPVPSAFR
ncbi:hypothetical protein ACTXT7_009234 [Hymenolepis weldensis]